MSQGNKYVETPLMKQYYAVKNQHPDAVLLFRVGDFYETFGEDAIRASEILGITLTRRANGSASFVELAGFPYHALDTYLPKLVRAGGSINDNILNHQENNFLANLISGLIAYSFLPKKPSINIENVYNKRIAKVA